MKRGAKLGALALGVLLLAGIVLLQSNRPVRPPLPVPNGYDDFVRAAQNTVSDGRAVHDLTDEELRTLTKENRAALELVRRGLQQKCRVATEYSPSYLTNHMPILSDFRFIGRLIFAEASLAERDGRTNDAARSCVDGIRFGQELARGGLVIDRMVGLACEALFPDFLLNLAPDLDEQTCRDLLPILEEADADREPLEVTWREEARWGGSLGLRQRLAGWFAQVLQARAWQAHRQRTQAKLDQVQLDERRALLQIAARAFELHHAQPPTRAVDLVPSFLRAVPKDPFTGADLTLPRLPRNDDTVKPSGV